MSGDVSDQLNLLGASCMVMRIVEACIAKYFVEGKNERRVSRETLAEIVGACVLTYEEQSGAKLMHAALSRVFADGTYAAAPEILKQIREALQKGDRIG